MKPKALGGPVFDDSPQSQDRRTRLASWLSGAENPFFAKSLVNRIWYHLIGRGIVEPVDDFRDSNPASNDELLDGLTAEFVKNGYHLKALIRSILRSRTYQLSATTNSLNVDDGLYFSHAQTKLLPAEVLLDAISTVTGTTTPFDGLPNGARATQIPDGKMENPFLKTFGRPARELACECERESESNLSQALQLIGGATVNGKLRDDNGRMAQLAKSGKTPAGDHPRALPGGALAASPAPRELEAAVKHLTAAEGPPPGRRGPGLGADQLQGVPVPALSPVAGWRVVDGSGYGTLPRPTPDETSLILKSDVDGNGVSNTLRRSFPSCRTCLRIRRTPHAGLERIRSVSILEFSASRVRNGLAAGRQRGVYGSRRTVSDGPGPVDTEFGSGRVETRCREIRRIAGQAV